MAGSPASPRVDPIGYHVQIVEPQHGHPTPFFIRQWQNLLDIIYDVVAAQTAADAAQSAADAAQAAIDALTASEVAYVNTTSGLAATDVQAAIDELSADALCRPILRSTIDYVISSANPCGTVFVNQ